MHEMNRKTDGGRVNRVARWPVLAVAGALALAAVGCVGVGPSASGTFERTLTVTGPVRLELINGSGNAQITAGEAGEVHIRGEVRVRTWPGGDLERLLKEFTNNPPIEQHGNLIHVGDRRARGYSASVSYTISVPAKTELQATVGSGHVEVRGIYGPAKMTTGSGSIIAENIREGAEVTAGSGGIAVANVEGGVHATTGSGGISMNEIRGDIRAMTGTGGITIADAGGRISAKTGSGGVTVSGATSDLRASTGSGHITIEGNPTPNSYWEMRTGSGGVEINVPADASFRLFAHASSGRIETNLPITIEERTKRELRGRIGAGAARVEVRTGAGAIHIR